MYKKILVPLDGSEFGEISLEHAKAIAFVSEDAQIVLLHVVEVDLPTIGRIPRPVPKVSAEQSRADAEQYLSEIKDKLTQQGLSVQTVIVDGKPHAAIIDYATYGHGIDLIVMATHGRSGPSQWFLGSVAEKVSRHSSVPILLVRPAGYLKPVNM